MGPPPMRGGWKCASTTTLVQCVMMVRGAPTKPMWCAISSSLEVLVSMMPPFHMSLSSIPFHTYQVSPFHSTCFNDADADAIAISGGDFGVGIGSILVVGGLACNGTEGNLISCPRTFSFQSLFCSHFDDAGVLCPRELSACTLIMCMLTWHGNEYH